MSYRANKKHTVFFDTVVYLHVKVIMQEENEKPYPAFRKYALRLSKELGAPVKDSEIKDAYYRAQNFAKRFKKIEIHEIIADLQKSLRDLETEYDHQEIPLWVISLKNKMHDDQDYISKLYSKAFGKEGFRDA